MPWVSEIFTIDTLVLQEFVIWKAAVVPSNNLSKLYMKNSLPLIKQLLHQIACWLCTPLTLSDILPNSQYQILYAHDISSITNAISENSKFLIQ